MKTLKIGGKDYTFEFSIEASLHDECIEKVTSLMVNSAKAGEEDGVNKIINVVSNIPKTALSMFYAGLIEHHGVPGDRTIMNESDAKELIKQYFVEHKDDEQGNFYSVMELMIACMADDGFFKRIGLEQMMGANQTEKTPKTPQDHKKKEAKAIEK